jgi:hypothetical protein
MQTIEAANIAETTKAVWATPVIETYDVAEFTLGGNGNNADAGNSAS